MSSCCEHGGRYEHGRRDDQKSGHCKHGGCCEHYKFLMGVVIRSPSGEQSPIQI